MLAAYHSLASPMKPRLQPTWAVAFALALALLAGSGCLGQPARKPEVSAGSSELERTTTASTTTTTTPRGLELKRPVSGEGGLAEAPIGQAKVSTTSAPKSNKTRKISTKNKAKQENQRRESSNPACEYERADWQECQNGTQTRLLKLKRASNENVNRCEPIKTIRRNCVKGCKYLRGEWSADCADGLRIRVDTLLPVKSRNSAPPELNRLPPANSSTSSWFSSGDQPILVGGCPVRRRVVKDCRRACHYLKSAWSECQDGFKSRNLTLQQWQPEPSRLSAPEFRLALNATSQSSPAPGDRGDTCKRSVLIRRECSGKQRQVKSARTADADQNATGAQRRQRKRQQQQQQPRKQEAASAR